VNATEAQHGPVNATQRGFNGHPPLGVNATVRELRKEAERIARVSVGTHPWG